MVPGQLRSSRTNSTQSFDKSSINRPKTTVPGRRRRLQRPSNDELPSASPGRRPYLKSPALLVVRHPARSTTPPLRCFGRSVVGSFSYWVSKRCTRSIRPPAQWYRPPTTRSFGRSAFDSNDSTNDEIPESKSWLPGPAQLPTHSVVQSFGLSVVRSFGLWVPRRLGWSVAHTPAQWFHPSFGRPQVVTVAPVVPVVPVVLVLQTTNDLNDPYNDEIPESKSSGPVVNPRLQRHPHDPVVPLVPLDKLVPQFQSSDLPNNPPVVVTQVRQQNLYRSTRPPSTTSNFGTRERTRWCPPP